MWNDLLRIAFEILDERHVPVDEWSLGGGTVLTLQYNHRISKDIDIFIYNAQYLPHLSPRLNRFAETRCTEYVESSNFVKLNRPEGEIDFIVSPSLTEKPVNMQTLEGRLIQVETPVEIVTKKLFYRAESLIIRDVVDTAVVFREQPAELLAEARVLKTTCETIRERWKRVAANYSKEILALELIDESLLHGDQLFEQYLEALARELGGGLL